MTASREERFDRVFADYHQRVYAYCRRRADEETAKDCASETFLIAWRRIGSVPDDDRTLPWLYEVARRVLANRYRSQRRFKRLITRLGGLASDPIQGPASQAIQHDENRQVLEGLGRLRRQDQELLRLAVWEELPHAAIGEILGCSAHAVDQRIRRAEDRLARELERAGHKHQLRAIPNPMRGEEGT
jgi:RNA polymerase sigma-70 factor (ECF subfamily)